MRAEEAGAKPVVRAPGRSMDCAWPCARLVAAEAAGADAGTLLCPLFHFTVLTCHSSVLAH